jgi:hypothetical protein
VLVAARSWEITEDETAGVDATRRPAAAGFDATLRPAPAGVDWWIEDMMTATATNTTTRDASATVVTKARLRRLGRPRVRKAGWTESCRIGVWLACSHRASGHDIDSDARSQFGMGGGWSRIGSGPQAGAGGDLAADSAADAVAESVADSGAKCTTSSTFAARCGVVADPAFDSSKERGTPTRRAPSASGACATLPLRIFSVGSGAFSLLSEVLVSVGGIPQYGRSGHRRESPFECPWPIALEWLGNALEGVRTWWL